MVAFCTCTQIRIYYFIIILILMLYFSSKKDLFYSVCLSYIGVLYVEIKDQFRTKLSFFIHKNM